MHAIYHHRTQGRDVEAVHIHGLAGGLEQLGYQVEIVGPPGVEADPNAVVTPVAGKAVPPLGWLAKHLPQALFEGMELGYNLVALPRLLQRCRTRRPALIYERYALYNAAGVLAGKLTGTPVVLEVNETARVDRTRQGKTLAMGWLARRLERWILRQATGLVVVSGYLKDQLIELGVPAERIRVTPNAVDAARFDPGQTDTRRVRTEHGLEGKTVVGFAGSFTKWHGIDLLIQAFAGLAYTFPDLRLLLVGDGVRRGEAEQLVAELGISDRVVFTGKVPHARMPEFVAAMDVGVMPASNLYGSPMKVFEYMAMGCPPVAPRYRPLEEAIADRVTGLLFEPNNLNDLTGCLRELVADPARRQVLGTAARRQVLERHLWVHNAETVAELAGRPVPPLGAVTALTAK